MQILIFAIEFMKNKSLQVFYMSHVILFKVSVHLTDWSCMGELHAP